MPGVLKETASRLLAHVFIIFITVIIWGLCEDPAKPTNTALPRLLEAALGVRRRVGAGISSFRGATAPPRGNLQVPRTRLAAASPPNLGS